MRVAFDRERLTESESCRDAIGGVETNVRLRTRPASRGGVGLEIETFLKPINKHSGVEKWHLVRLIT